MKPVLNQVTAGATLGDAITDEAFLLRRWLRWMGFDSQIYAAHIHPALEKEVRPASAYRPQPGEEWLVYHHSIGATVVDQLLASPLKLIMIYHNITPSEFFAKVDPALAQQMVLGRDQLAALPGRTPLALADSPFSVPDLEAAGYPRAGVLPITLDESLYKTPAKAGLPAQSDGAGPLLFVGRVVPSKKQEDLLKLLYHYRRFCPGARLVLVGDPWVPAYARWLREFAIELNLQDAVTFAGHVSQADLVAHYATAGLYVSMSEHEGFGKPLIESMYLGLPILAYDATAVRYTLGGAGVLFRAKDYPALAELVDLLSRDGALRQRLIAGQKERVQAFLAPQVYRQWQGYLADLGLVRADLESPYD
jgi:L-malate glycosyltransferase